MKPTSESTDLTRFDVRDIPCSIKPGQIFQRWTDLPVGGHFILINDHDPVPLYYQFERQFPGAFDWKYLVRGPQEFQVKITRLATSSATVNVAPKSTCAADPESVLDVRPIPSRFKHTKIFELWNGLRPGDSFVLLNDHDPVPLRYQFEAEYPQAFSWEYLEAGPDEFRVKITKLPRVTRHAIEVDARGLEPPEPLMRILSALETLPAGITLRAITDREPCHLFGEAQQRGFKADCKSQPNGSWLTLLTRA